MPNINFTTEEVSFMTDVFADPDAFPSEDHDLAVSIESKLIG